jgi:colanic acid/amylovoran biosynthesis glycosyltransferase
MSLAIAIFVWNFPVLSETFVINIVTGLIDRGHRVDIYALGGPQAHLAKVHPDVDRYKLLERTFYPLPTPQNRVARVVKKLGLVGAQGLSRPASGLHLLAGLRRERFPDSWKNVLSLAPLLDKPPYDLIHGQFGPNGLAAVALRQLGGLKAKVITSFRGYEFGPYLQKHGLTVFDPLFRSGDLFLPNSDYFGRRLAALGCPEHKIQVYRSGVDCKRFAFVERRQPQEGRVRIVTVGRLVEKKGIEYAVRAITRLLPQHPNIQYDIIGDGPLRPTLQALIDSLGLQSQVKLLGPKQQSELIVELEHAHIMIAPSVTSETGDQDAPINTLKEAMATGMPVIGTWHGGIPELVEDGLSGYLVPERDSEALATRLDELIQHPERWAPMGQAGRKQVEINYNLEALNDRLVDLYQQVLAQP